MADPNSSSAPPPSTGAPAAQPRVRGLRLAPFALALVFSSVTVAMIYRIRSREVAELEKSLLQQRTRKQELSRVAARNLIYRHQIDELKLRLDTIWQLQHDRVGPSSLLKQLNAVMSRTAGISLRAMALSPSGQRIVLSGQARSPESMKKFLTDVERSRNFSDARLRQFYQENGRNPAIYRYTLDCAYSPGGKTPAAPAPPKR